MTTETATAVAKRILLVDDERVLREALKTILLRKEYDVVEANNGAEAFSIFSQSKFDLVLTDGTMPFVNGDELAVRIRQMAPEQPILMITGFDYKRGARNPVDAVLQKPFDSFLLEEAITSLL